MFRGYLWKYDTIKMKKKNEGIGWIRTLHIVENEWIFWYKPLYLLRYTS